MAKHPQLDAISLQGYRPFNELQAFLGSCEVIVGANGSGKSSLFEFLRALRDGLDGELPPGLVPGGANRTVYHAGTKESIHWALVISGMADADGGTLGYEGLLTGPFGRDVEYESVLYYNSAAAPHEVMNSHHGRGLMRDISGGTVGELREFDFSRGRTGRLSLGGITDPSMTSLRDLQSYIRRWGFYGSFSIDAESIRRPVVLDQRPTLRDDAGNLSAVLQYIRNEHQATFDELQDVLGLLVPGFKGITLKGYGGPGQVMAFWSENGSANDLNLADLSDGILRLICWAVLCVMPEPPTLVCIDEPDQGVHPRTLPVLAGLFEKASQRTQILLTTHNSYFLAQFGIDRVAVMRKEGGAATFIKPKDSRVLMSILDDFGTEELELLHRSEELERLP